MIGKLVGQTIFYGLTAFALGYLSASPVYTHMEEDQAMITVSFSHGAERKIPCRRRTREELQALPPNMRKPMDCSRERLPVYVEVVLDGQLLIKEMLPPMGLAKDGQSQIYRRLGVKPGEHTIAVGIRDTSRQSGFDYSMERKVRLSSRQNLVVDFDDDKGVLLLNERMVP